MNHVVSAVSGWHLNQREAVEVEVQRIRCLRPAFSHRPFAGILASTPLEMRRHFLGTLEETGLIGSEWRTEHEAAPEGHLRAGNVPAAE